MRKIYLLIIAISLQSTITFSQEFAIGIKGGFNKFNIGDILSFGGSFEQGAPNETFSPNNEMNIHFGAFLDISFGKFFIRPELTFGSIQNSYDFPFKTSNWETSKVDIPVHVGYKIFDPIAIYIGPNISLLKSVTLDGANNTPEASPIPYEKNLTNINVGIMVEFKRFGVDLRYGLPSKEITTMRNDLHFSAYGINQADILTYKPSQVSLSLNIFLFRTDGDEIGGLFSGLFKSNKCWCPD